MEDLLKAITIFLKYGNPYAPTHCEHDELFVNIQPGNVSDEDKKQLEILGFDEHEEYDMFWSCRFGSR